MVNDIRRRCDAAVWPVALIIVLAGCGKEKAGATVSGHVFYKGKPLADGSLAFIPRGAPVAKARTLEDGSYSLRGPGGEERIKATAYDVVIFGPETHIRGTDEERAKAGFGVPLSVTKLMTTPLHYDVIEGPNNIEIDLDKLPDDGKQR